MRRFLLRLLAFLTIQALVLGVVLARYQPEQDHYLASTVDKHARLAAPGAERLVFIGGSGVAFGFDCETLARRLPLTPINMGLHADLGLGFMLDEVQPHLRAGDTAVVVPEYQQFHGCFAPLPLVRVLEHNPQAARHLTPALVARILDRAALPYLRGVMRSVVAMDQSPRRRGYSRSAFNAYGDVVAHRGVGVLSDVIEKLRDRPLFAEGQASHARSIRATVSRLNAFAETCRGDGVRVYFAYPAVPRHHFLAPRSRALIAEIRRAVERGLTFPRLNQPSQAVLPLDHFYDTLYHLNGRGARARTAALAATLARQLASDGVVDGRARFARGD